MKNQSEIEKAEADQAITNIDRAITNEMEDRTFEPDQLERLREIYRQEVAVLDSLLAHCSPAPTTPARDSADDTFFGFKDV